RLLVFLSFWQIRMRIAHRAEICSPRTSVQFAQHVVSPRIRLFTQLAYAAVWIVRIAKHDRFRWARLFASRYTFAVLHAAVVFRCFDSSVVDALHAVRALFHHASAANRHFWIAHQLERRRLPILEAQEVESPHFIRAVVRAVARPDAAVVDHVVQAFLAVHGRAYRANFFARCVFALLARHGLEVCLWIGQLGIFFRLIFLRFQPGLVVPVNADPVHLAAAHHLIFADDRNIVLALASDYARVA